MAAPAATSRALPPATDSPSPASFVTTPSVLEAFRNHASEQSNASRPSPLDPEAQNDAAVQLLPTSREEARKESWNAVSGLDMTTPVRPAAAIAASRAALAATIPGGGEGAGLERRDTDRVPYLEEEDSRGASPFPRTHSASQSPHAAAGLLGARPRPSALARCTSLTNEMDDAGINAMRRLDPSSAVGGGSFSGIKPFAARSPSEVESKVAASDAAVPLHTLPSSSPWLPPRLVRMDARDGAVIRETASLVAGWLLDHGFTESLRALRSDVGMNGRDEFMYRKSLRAVAGAVTEGRWDAALSAVRNLFTATALRQEQLQQQMALLSSSRPTPLPGATSSSPLDGQQQTRTTSPNVVDPGSPTSQAYFDTASAEKRVTLLLLEQQLLELVDSGDTSKAFNLLCRKIKPQEADLAPQRFQRLLYTSACKSVGEAAAGLAALGDRSLQGWSVESGRASLVQEIRRELTASHAASEGHFGNLLGTDTYISRHTIPILPPQSLHSVMEMAASYQAIRLALLTGSASPQEVLAALSDPLASPLTVQSCVTPLSAQLPPLRVLHSVQALPPNVQARAAAGQPLGLCRTVYVPSARCIVYGTTDGGVFAITRASVFTSPLSDLKATKLAHEHFGAVSGLAVVDRAVFGSAPLLLSASVDGSAALRTLSVDSRGNTTTQHFVAFGQDTHGDSAHITACALLPDGTIALLGDARGRVTFWTTGISPTPAAASNRHTRTAAGAAATASHAPTDRSPALVPMVSYLLNVGDGSDAKASSPLSTPALLHLVALDHKLLPQASHCGNLSNGGKVNPQSARAATSWAANAIVAIEVARHGLHVITLQKSGVVCCIGTAVGAVLRRIAAPDTLGRLGDASSLAMADSALHAFVAFGTSKVVRVLNMTDGTWTRDAFVLDGSSKDSFTSVATVSGDGFLVAGTATGKVVSWPTVVERPATSTLYDIAVAAAQPAGNALRVHAPVSIVDVDTDAPPAAGGLPRNRAIVDIRYAECVSFTVPASPTSAASVNMLSDGRVGEGEPEASVIQGSPLMAMLYPGRAPAAESQSPNGAKAAEIKMLLTASVDGTLQWIGTPAFAVTP